MAFPLVASTAAVMAEKKDEWWVENWVGLKAALMASSLVGCLVVQ